MNSETTLQHELFLRNVQQQAELNTLTEASEVVRVTLETLGARMAGSAVDRLAAQLPRPLARHLYSPTSVGQGHATPLQEFFNVIQAEEGVALSEATYHAKAVIVVLRQTVSPNVLKDVLQLLPRDYHPLFENFT